MKARISHNRVIDIQDENGKICSLGEEIEKEAVDYFSIILGSWEPNKKESVPLVDRTIERMVSHEDNERLMAPYSFEEVKKAAFSLQPHKAPGPDGFTTEFFQRCWDFMGEDIAEVVEDFRKNRRFVKSINRMMIVLISKKPTCTTMSDYRPISLCNVLYKIISKAMSERLKKILNRLISENQNGFTPGRELEDSIILTLEAIHSMAKNRIKGMAIKLDVSKAYDRVLWYFLEHVLRRFGLDSLWIDCIKFCIFSICFSILVNGAVCGFFAATNGLRQGNPLSPSLLILMAEVLGNNIKNKLRGVFGKELQSIWRWKT